MKFNQNNLNYFALLLPITVFTKEIGAYFVGGTLLLDLIAYPFFVVTFGLYLVTKQIKVSQTELFIFLWFLIVILINLLFGTTTNISNPLVQFSVIFLVYYSAKSILQSSNILHVFYKYLDYAVFTAFLGIIQVALKLVGIHILSKDDTINLDSLAFEPSHYVIIILPALIYYFEKREYSWKFYLILISLILTFKTTAILAILFYGVYRFLIFTGSIRSVLLGIFIATLVILTVQNFEGFAIRANSFSLYLSDRNLGYIDNLTIFSFVSNIEVALSNFLSTYGLGVGLGGHKEMYSKVVDITLFADKGFAWTATNAATAHSLLIRVISELGIFGVSFWAFLMYRISKIKNLELKLIAMACVGHFLAKIIKQGGYYDYGTVFFLVMILATIRYDRRGNLL